MRLDEDDLDEAIASAIIVPSAGRQTATDAQISRFRDGLTRVLAIIPADVTVGELRALLGLTDD